MLEGQFENEQRSWFEAISGEVNLHLIGGQHEFDSQFAWRATRFHKMLLNPV